MSRRNIPDVADRRAWDSFTVAGRLYIREAQALELLQAMQQAGMCTPVEDSGFAYAPAMPELARLVDALAVTYSQNLVGVTDLIHSRVEKRAHQFADCGGAPAAAWAGLGEN